MAPRPKPHNIVPPMDDRRIEAINQNFDTLFKDVQLISGRPLLSADLADVVAADPARGDLIVGTPDGVTIKWSVLALGQAGRVLRSNGTDPSWAQVVLTSDVIGILPIENGGSARDAFTEFALLAGGLTPTGALQQVSGLGTAGQVLTSQGAAALPAWEDAAEGGGGMDEGYWTPITDGVTPIAELLFDSNGDCIVGFVPTP